jgi:predicted ATPase/DNA-binding winged helix-turn-helix (wHTH) protein
MGASATNSGPNQVRDDEGIAFGRYRIFPKLNLLLRDSDKITISPRAFDVLWMLVKADGELVSKDDLLDTVWSGVIVEENNLQTQMSAIRRALGPDRRMIRTEFGHGYRLVAEVRKQAWFMSPDAEPTRPAHATLPLPLTPLLGRIGELDEIERLFTRRRLVTITGAGGIGKTRLAIEIGHRVTPRYPDGVHLAEMAKISGDELVGTAIATTLRMNPPDFETAEGLSALLFGKRCLLIIDNCEHLVEPIARVVEIIMRYGDGFHVLVTSQEPLGVEGEQVYRLAPLSAPAAGTRDFRAAIAHTAFELFVERAAASGHALELDEDTVEAVGAICRRLDGLPLALELAAARVAGLGVQGVLAALDDRFQLLTAGRRTALARHRTLRATIDWSFHLLNEMEQSILRRLAVFTASFDADAARAIAASEYDSPWPCLDVLSGLVGKSLLLLDPGRPVPRYRFLETVRFYALEKLAESGEVDLTAARHATYLAGVIRRASEDWKVLPTDEWRQKYEEMGDDLRSSLDWTFSEKGDARTAVEILVHAPPFWMLLSLHDECRRRTLQALNDRPGRGSLPAVDEMRLHTALGTALSWATGPVRETRAAWERALELARQQSATEVELQAQYGLWLYSLRSGRYGEALQHATDMMRLAARESDEEALAVGRRLAGIGHHFLGHHEQARELVEESLRWHETTRPHQAFRFGMDQRIAGLAFLSRILWVLGFADRARELAASAVADARALDHATTLCCAIAEGWCTVHALEGDHEAVRRETKALKLAAGSHGLEFWRTYGDLFELWAEIHAGAEIQASAIDALVFRVEALDFDPGYSVLLTDIALCVRKKARVAPALARLSAGLMQTPVKPSWAEPEFRRVAAHFSGNDAATIVAMREALSVSEAQRAPAWSLRIVVDLAEILVKQGNPREAASLLDAALVALPEGNHGVEMAVARTLAVRLRG